MAIDNEKIKERAQKAFYKGLDAYMKRTGKTARSLSLEHGRSQSSIRNMINTNSLPGFDFVFSLLDNGMTLEECFGPELAAKIAPRQSQNMDVETILQNLSPEEISLVSKRFAYLGLAGLLADLQRPADPKEHQA